MKRMKIAHIVAVLGALMVFTSCNKESEPQEMKSITSISGLLTLDQIDKPSTINFKEDGWYTLASGYRKVDQYKDSIPSMVNCWLKIPYVTGGTWAHLTVEPLSDALMEQMIDYYVDQFIDKMGNSGYYTRTVVMYKSDYGVSTNKDNGDETLVCGTFEEARKYMKANWKTNAQYKLIVTAGSNTYHFSTLSNSTDYDGIKYHQVVVGVRKS